ncbi:MAG: hypothetical protein GOU99_03645 [Candidatus Altiarchaeota archaeon]|nr:hypothetical protein [Candidatus Altiarchaeota archaeon]
MGFAEIVLEMAKLGLFQFFFPFALVFIILYALLLKYKILGDDKGVMSGAVAFIISLFLMLYGVNVYIANFLAWVLGRAGILIILLLMGLVIAAFVKEQAGGGE